MIIREKVNCHEIISFPVAFSPDKTPYTEVDFSDHTKFACLSLPPFIPGLRMCKVILIGDVNVGKTSIVSRFCRQLFSYSYKATIGVDFEVEQFNILKVPFNMQIWDTAGQERFRCIAAAYYRSAHAIVTVFDLTSSKSLDHCQVWTKEALDAIADTPLKFLVGTKKDLVKDSVHNEIENEAGRIAKEMEAEYWAVSSRTGEGVKELFYRIAALSFDKIIKAELHNPNNEKRLCLGQRVPSTDKKNQVRQKGCQSGKETCAR